MKLYQVTTADPARPNPAVVADDELAALDRATDAGLLEDGDEGNVEQITLEEPDVEAYEPEGPG